MGLIKRLFCNRCSRDVSLLEIVDEMADRLIALERKVEFLDRRVSEMREEQRHDI